MAIKLCIGKDKAKGYGCGNEIQYAKRGNQKIYFQKYGLATIKCNCYQKWLHNSEEGQEETIKRSKGMYVTQKPRAVSKKRQAENSIYTKERKKFLSENTICFIENCGAEATTIEHTRGRIGYADDFAKENKISLYLDTRFWKPCCLKHNLELESNPELSQKYQKSKIHGGEKINKSN